MKAKLLAGLLGRVLVTLPVAGLFCACELVREDLAECYVPVVELRFVYEYNMEFANAFHNQVDCLSAYFFDEEGLLIDIETVTDRSLLADEEYRMHPELPAGNYHVVAYGGMACENASFYPVKKIELGMPCSDLRVRLDRYVTEAETPSDARRLHNHFYGAADFTVAADADTRATVRMMRNTNSIQIALQNEMGGEIDCNDFIFEITDDNNDFDSENNLLATGEITYRPYNTENRSTGTVPPADTDGYKEQEWHAALAQFHTSRLVLPTVGNNKQTATRLLVWRADEGRNGKPSFSIPLLNYMLMFKHDNMGAGDAEMSDQEYLDRENSWRFVFFLKNNDWYSAHIIVNDWEVRMNDIDW